MARLTLLDETASGNLLHRLELEVIQETLTVGELIARRVHEEVAASNAHLTNVFEGLVQPVGSQRVGNRYHLAEPRLLDAEEQTYRALEAFRQNRFFLLVNDQQAESLDEEIWLGDGATVSFIKLTPLVGG